MRKLLALFLTASFCGCSNSQQKDLPQSIPIPSTTEQAPVERKFFSTTVTFASTVNGINRKTFINCSFYKQNEDIGASLATDILYAVLRKSAAEAIQMSEQQQPVYVDTLAAELHTTKLEKTIKPLPPGNDNGVEKSINLLLPDLLDYWHACHVPFLKKSVACTYAGYTPDQFIDTANVLKIVLSGGIFYQYEGDMKWFAKNQFSANSPLKAEFNSNGESNQKITVTRKSPPKWMISSGSNEDIVIDVANTSKAEAIQSACMEMTHRMVATWWIKKMTEHLNTPPYYSNYEPVIKEYLRLNEIAVHYSMICFMEGFFKKGLYTKKDIPDPLIQYSGESYKGLIALLKRYPPSRKNGIMVMQAFMKDPMNINKF